MNEYIKSRNNNDDNDKNIYINGPINYIKLYNKEKNQSVLLLMDYHASIDKQKKCDNNEAKDVNSFLYYELKKSKEPIDFFLEIIPTDINYININSSNDNYINETRKIFKKIYRENKIKPNSYVRLHYVDIRDYAFINDIAIIIKNILSLLESNKLDQIGYVIKQLVIVKKILEFINDYIKKTLENKLKYKPIDKINIKLSSTTNSDNESEKKYTKSELIKFGFAELLDKILNKYVDIKLKKNINEYFQKNYLDVSKKLIDHISSLIHKISSIHEQLYKTNSEQELIEKEIILDDKLGLKSKYIGFGMDFFEYEKNWESILNEINKIYLMIINMGSVFVDCFFIRRLLEKNNITRSIVYTGMAHTVMYIWFLIKYYDYTIEDYYYINKDKLDKNNPTKNLEKIIKNTNDPITLFKYVIPKKFSQCIKINFK